MVKSLVCGWVTFPKNVLRLTSVWPRIAWKLSFIFVLCTFRENQEISRVGPRLTCGQSVNCKPMMFLQPTERRASPSRNISHKSLLLPGWALGRIYSCSLSSTLPTIITLELEHQHLATLAICKKKCALCMLRTKTYTKSLIFQFQSIWSGKIELSQQNET